MHVAGGVGAASGEQQGGGGEDAVQDERAHGRKQELGLRADLWRALLKEGSHGKNTEDACL